MIINAKKNEITFTKFEVFKLFILRFWYFLTKRKHYGIKAATELLWEGWRK